LLAGIGLGFWALAAAGAIIALPVGCGGDAAAESTEKPGEAERGRNQRARKKMAEIRKKLEKLPQDGPDQRVIYIGLKKDFDAIKINFEAKSKARVGMVTQDVYHATMMGLEDLERRIKAFPKS
jgi:hypothetical protein